MGSPLSPVVANLYMASLEDRTINKRMYESIEYYRYLDDVIMIEGHGMKQRPVTDIAETLKRMKGLTQSLSNKSENNLLFEHTATAYEAGDSVDYLDLKIRITKDDRLQHRKKIIRVSVFDKPTNLHIYTDPSTFYPFHYVYNWIQGENIRLIRNSSTSEDHEQALQAFKTFLLRRNYAEEQIERFVGLNYFEDRRALLDGEKPHKERKGLQEQDNNDRTVLIRNSGVRPLMESSIRIVSNYSNALSLTNFRMVPVVEKGKSIISVLDKAKKDLAKNL
jgi:hypothetical protein